MNLTNDTSLALMQATQSQAAQAVQNAKSAQTKTNMSEKDMARFDAVSKDFEAMFVAEMMKPMFEGIKPDPRFGGGKGEEIFQGMMLQEYGKMMADTGQLGIADSIKLELIRMQSEADDGPVR